MFKCADCKEFTKPRERMEKVVVKTREKEYHNKVKKPKQKLIQTIVSKGWEVVEEIGICRKCSEKRKKLELKKFQTT